MPNSGPVHAINFQSIRTGWFERSEKFLYERCSTGFSDFFQAWSRTVFGQRKDIVRVCVVRNTPEAGTRPINAIKS
jgi:hypothetical protein